MASFPYHSGCSNSLEHHAFSGVRLFLRADGGPKLTFPGMANQSKATGQLLLGQLAWNKVSGSYLQSRGGSASWLSTDCTSWSAYNSFQTTWPSFWTLNLLNTILSTLYFDVWNAQIIGGVPTAYLDKKRKRQSYFKKEFLKLKTLNFHLYIMSFKI